MTEPMGLLVAGMNYSPVAADEFNAWYNEEHLPALAALCRESLIERGARRHAPRLCGFCRSRRLPP